MTLADFSKRVAPHILGNSLFKQFVTIQLFTNPLQREKFHLLAVGDVASGKSDLGEHVTHLIRDGQFCSRKITAVGLAEKANMADGSILTLDELDKIEKDALFSLLECMQTGKITSDKFGEHDVFDARINVLGLCNPNNYRINPRTNVYSQIRFPQPIKSRFHAVIPIFSIPESRYEDISVMKNDKSLIDDTHINELKVEIAKLKQKNEEVLMSVELAKMVGKYVEHLKKYSPMRVAASPRTIEGIQSGMRALARMNDRCEALEEDFVQLRGLYDKLFR